MVKTSQIYETILTCLSVLSLVDPLMSVPVKDLTMSLIESLSVDFTKGESHDLKWSADQWRQNYRGLKLLGQNGSIVGPLLVGHETNVTLCVEVLWRMSINTTFVYGVRKNYLFDNIRV